MPSLGPPIDLEPLDYEQWVEAERGWFKVQFPWIFVLQEAIRKNRENPRHDGSVPSYPELLLQTGDIWQAVYPERFYRIIPVANAKSLSKLATEYGLGDSWPTPDTGSVNGRHSRQDGMVFGLASLEKWLLDCRKIQSVCESGRELSTLFEHSQAMAEYLEHTRGLAWLCVQNGQLLVAPEHRERMLYLLRGQVAGAHAIRTILRRIENLGGGDSTLGTCQREIVKTIESIIECERGIGGKLGPRIIK